MTESVDEIYLKNLSHHSSKEEWQAALRQHPSPQASPSDQIIWLAILAMGASRPDLVRAMCTHEEFNSVLINKSSLFVARCVLGGCLEGLTDILGKKEVPPLWDLEDIDVPPSMLWKCYQNNHRLEKYQQLLELLLSTLPKYRTPDFEDTFLKLACNNENLFMVSHPSRSSLLSVSPQTLNVLINVWGVEKVALYCMDNVATLHVLLENLSPLDQQKVLQMSDRSKWDAWLTQAQTEGLHTLSALLSKASLLEDIPDVSSFPATKHKI